MAFVQFMASVIGGAAVATVLLAGAIKALQVVQTKAALSSANKALLR
jgi:hypothetical protein